MITAKWTTRIVSIGLLLFALFMVIFKSMPVNILTVKVAQNAKREKSFY